MSDTIVYYHNRNEYDCEYPKSDMEKLQEYTISYLETKKSYLEDTQKAKFDVEVKKEIAALEYALTCIVNNIEKTFVNPADEDLSIFEILDILSPDDIKAIVKGRITPLKEGQYIQVRDISPTLHDVFLKISYTIGTLDENDSSLSLCHIIVSLADLRKYQKEHYGY